LLGRDIGANCHGARVLTAQISQRRFDSAVQAMGHVIEIGTQPGDPGKPGGTRAADVVRCTGGPTMTYSRTRTALLALALGVAALGVVGASGCGGAYYYAEVDSYPPDPAYDDIYFDARDGYVWVEGRWVWDGSQWAWRDGYWLPSRSGYVYIQGYWHSSGGRWYWRDGRWATHRPGHIYVRGHWTVTNGRRVWSPGRWERQRTGYDWQSGHWERQGNRRVWRDGHWQRSGTRSTPSRGVRTRDHRRPTETVPSRRGKR
jgi:hypothetical protein